MNTKSSRLDFIDNLRGLAMLAMMVVHTTVYFLTNGVTVFLWNLGQISVPLFLFCSSYLYFYRVQSEFNLSSIWKRLKRLYIPYFLFALAFFILIWFQTPHKISVQYTVQSFFLTGGIEINWLVLLFIEFIFLLPLLEILKQKRILLGLYSLFVLFISVLSLFTHIPIEQRLIMWIGWSSVPLFILFYLQHQPSKRFLWITGIGSFVVFILLFFLEQSIHHSVNLYDNKYPPTIYFVMFSIISMAFGLLLSQTKLFAIPIFQQLIRYLSKYSYSIFFIHYWLLIFFSSWIGKGINIWEEYLLIVLLGSIGIQYIGDIIVAWSRKYFFS